MAVKLHVHHTLYSTTTSTYIYIQALTLVSDLTLYMYMYVHAIVHVMQATRTRPLEHCDSHKPGGFTLPLPLKTSGKGRKDYAYADCAYM